MSLLKIWAALLAVSLGIFAITLDGSMMPVAIGSIVANAYLSAFQNTLEVILGVIVVMILVSFGFARKRRRWR